MATESDEEFHCASQRTGEKSLSSVDIIFITEARNCAASASPPATLRQLILALQKYLEISGSVENFLSDVKFKVCHIYTYLIII